MEARCPHCGSVFETARTGPQFCPNCGQQVNVASVPPPPTAVGSSPAGPGDQDTPWERRKELGLWKGFFETWKSSLLTPQTFWSSIRPTGKMGDALFYSWIIQVVAQVIAVPFLYLQRDTTREAIERLRQYLPPEYMTILDRYGAGDSVPVLPSVLLSAVLWPLIVVIGAAVTHLFCLILGAHKNGFEATFRAVCYSSAPLVFGFHGCTRFLAVVYASVLMVFGITKLQETTNGRAVGVVVAPYALCTCCVCISIFAAAGLIAKGVMSTV